MSIDTILGILGTVLGVTGLIAAYFFYRKSLKLKEPLYFISSNNLIQDNISKMNGLEVKFKGHKVENLTTSKVLFWNNGKETINKMDIVSTNPLRIECSTGNRILDVNILQVNNPSSQFLVEAENDGFSARIIFDYLDKDQGAVIQVVHTGKTSNDIIIKGDLKGAFLRLHLSKRKLVDTLTSLGAAFLAIIFSSLVYFLVARNVAAVWKITLAIVVGIISSFALAYPAQWIDDKLSDKIPTSFKKFGQ